MTSEQNRRLHALAGRIHKPAAHEILKDLAFDLCAVKSLSDLTTEQVELVADRLNQTINRGRMKETSAAQKSGSISNAQLGYARKLQKLLGWSSEYMQTFLTQRYQEETLEGMPNWKAVRLIAEMHKRWESKKHQAVSKQIKQTTFTTSH